MGRIQDLERKISRLQSTIAARDRTIGKLRGELGELQGVLQEVSDGLEPLGGLTSKTTELTHVLQAFADGGIQGIGRYGELLPQLADGPLSHARDLARLAVGPLGSLGGGSGEPGSKLRQTVTELVEEIEAIAAGMPDLPPLPLRPMLGQVTALIEAAPAEILARLDALWESSGLYARIAATRQNLADWADAAEQTLYDTAFHIAYLNGLISNCEALAELLPADVSGGGEAAGGAGPAGGAGASAVLVSLGKGILGLVISGLKIIVMLMEAEVAVKEIEEL